MISIEEKQCVEEPYSIAENRKISYFEIQDLIKSLNFTVQDDEQHRLISYGGKQNA